MTWAKVPSAWAYIWCFSLDEAVPDLPSARDLCPPLKAAAMLLPWTVFSGRQRQDLEHPGLESPISRWRLLGPAPWEAHSGLPPGAAWMVLPPLIR